MGQRIVIGMGCRKGCPPAEALSLAHQVLTAASRPAGEVVAIATLAARSQEPALLAVSVHYGVPLLTFPAERLEIETPRLATPSDVVFRETGCHGVAEAAALAACGPSARLIVTKQIHGGATAAVAEGGGADNPQDGPV